MRIVRYHEFGDPDVLRLEEIPQPDPEPDEVLIETDAIGVNPCDVLRRKGLWEDELPLISGSDIAGTVEVAGDQVDKFDVGDRVFGTVPRLNVSGTRGDRQGTYADYVVVREDRLALLPNGVAAATGAGLGLVGITAWRALRHFGDLEPGDICLIHGGSGGVGHVAVQLASTLGATVLSTASNPRMGVVRDFGADEVFDYAQSVDSLQTAVSTVAEDGVDIVLDHKIGDYIQFDINISGYGGTVVAIGNNYDNPTIDDFTEAIGKDVTIQPMDMFNEPNIDEVLRRLSMLLQQDRLEINVADSFTLENASKAHQAVENDSFVGKIIIKP